MKIHNQDQKGISSSFGILIIVIIAIVAVGGAFAYQYVWNTDKPVEKVEQKLTQEQLEQIEQKMAEKVVVDAFTYLHNEEYDKAVPFFAWEQLEEHDHLFYYYAEGESKEKALKISCGGGNYKGGYNCSEFTVVDRKKLGEGEYAFKLQFTINGKIRTYACCGMEPLDLTEEEWEKYGFSFRVKKIEGEYKVMRGPYFTP